MAPRHPRLQSGGWIRLLNSVLDDERVGGHGADHFALWVAGLTFCNRNRTDGLIPKIKLPGIAGDIPLKLPMKVAALLVRTGAWIDEGTHWRVNNYLVYQSSREEIDSYRKANADRMSGKRSREQDANVRANADGTDDEGSREVRTLRSKKKELLTPDDNNRVLSSGGPSESDVERPAPERPAPDVSSSSEQKTADDLVKQVCRELATRSLAGRPDVENPEAWHATTRRTLHTEKGHAIAAFAAANPGLDAVAIAEHFEAKTSAARPPKPADPVEATARARARLDAENDAKRAADAAAEHDRQCEFERRWALLSEAEQHAVTAQAKASVPERLKGRFGPEQAALQAAVLAIPANRVTPDGRQPNQEQTMNELQEARA